MEQDEAVLETIKEIFYEFGYEEMYEELKLAILFNIESNIYFEHIFMNEIDNFLMKMFEENRTTFNFNELKKFIEIPY